MLCPHVIQVAGKIARLTIGDEVAEGNGFSKRIKSFFRGHKFPASSRHSAPCGEMATMNLKRRGAAISPLMPPITAGRLAIAMNRDGGHSDQLATI
jgi:hypothetical protein